MSDALKVKELKVAVAFLSAGIGLMVLAIINFIADKTGGNAGAFAKSIALHQGIGPYSGKQFFTALAWGLSWIILHQVFVKKGTAEPKKIMRLAYIFIIVAGLMVFPPVLDLL